MLIGDGSLRGAYIAYNSCETFQQFKGCVVMLIYTPYIYVVIYLANYVFIYLYLSHIFVCLSSMSGYICIV